jgi:hypothetical protein
MLHVSSGVFGSGSKRADDDVAATVPRRPAAWPSGSGSRLVWIELQSRAVRSYDVGVVVHFQQEARVPEAPAAPWPGPHRRPRLPRSVMRSGIAFVAMTWLVVALADGTPSLGPGRRPRRRRRRGAEPRASTSITAEAPGAELQSEAISARAVDSNAPAAQGGQLGDRPREHQADVHLPAPSIWPAVLAAGVSLIAFGILTSHVFTVVGAVVFAWALAGWIAELRQT